MISLYGSLKPPTPHDAWHQQVHRLHGVVRRAFHVKRLYGFGVVRHKNGAILAVHFAEVLFVFRLQVHSPLHGHVEFQALFGQCGNGFRVRDMTVVLRLLNRLQSLDHTLIHALSQERQILLIVFQKISRSIPDNPTPHTTLMLLLDRQIH